MNVAVRPTNGLTVPWYQDPKMVALVKRTAAKDCNVDEFDEFTAVCRELGLNPLRKQIYAFVFSKDKPAERNMAIVVGIDGGRSIAARTGNYRPDNQPPVWVTSEEAKDPDTNPEGIVSATVGAFHRPTKNDPFERIVATVFWREFVPIVRTADPDAYEWIDTGETWPDSGKPKKVKRLRVGAQADVKERLDPKKKQWTNMGRHKLALCAEMQVLRRGWPENLARVYVDEETDKASAVLDLGGSEYADLTPSQMADRAETDARMERIGGPAIMATFDDAGTIERVPYGLFADRVLDATAKWPAERVVLFMERNREALKEFWAHNKTDALKLKKVLEERSGITTKTASAPAATSASDRSSGGEDSSPARGKAAPGALPVGTEAFTLKTKLLTSLARTSHHPTSSAGPRAHRCT
jgi:phage recombination protein Bet